MSSISPDDTAPFSIDDIEVDATTHVVDVAGEVDLYSAPELKEHVLAAIDAGKTRIVVDLSRTTFIDSTTLGVLVGARKRLREYDGALAVVCADEDKLHLWLTESETPADAANSILASWKDLSEPGRTAAAQHLANLVADEQFQPVANILLDLKSSQEVQSILFADILNRQDSLKWPLIMKVLETKGHPLSQEARTILTVVLGRDYGDDWAKWQDRVDKDLWR